MLSMGFYICTNARMYGAVQFQQHSLFRFVTALYFLLYTSLSRLLQFVYTSASAAAAVVVVCMYFLCHVPYSYVFELELMLCKYCACVRELFSSFFLCFHKHFYFGCYMFQGMRATKEKVVWFEYGKKLEKWRKKNTWSSSVPLTVNMYAYTYIDATHTAFECISSFFFLSSDMSLYLAVSVYVPWRLWICKKNCTIGIILA